MVPFPSAPSVNVHGVYAQAIGSLLDSPLARAVEKVVDAASRGHCDDYPPAAQIEREIQRPLIP